MLINIFLSFIAIFIMKLLKENSLFNKIINNLAYRYIFIILIKKIIVLYFKLYDFFLKI